MFRELTPEPRNRINKLVRNLQQKLRVYAIKLALVPLTKQTRPREKETYILRIVAQPLPRINHLNQFPQLSLPHRPPLRIILPLLLLLHLLLLRTRTRTNTSQPGDRRRTNRRRIRQTRRKRRPGRREILRVRSGGRERDGREMGVRSRARWRSGRRSGGLRRGLVLLRELLDEVQLTLAGLDLGGCRGLDSGFLSFVGVAWARSRNGSGSDSGSVEGGLLLLRQPFLFRRGNGGQGIGGGGRRREFGSRSGPGGGSGNSRGGSGRRPKIRIRRCTHGGRISQTQLSR